jgi:hypothetical protein
MSFPNLTFWSGLLETVGLEVCALVALGFVAQFTFRRAYWQRAMWQMTMICVMLVSASEWTGFGRGTVWYLLGPTREVSHVAAPKITTLRSDFTGRRPMPFFDQRVAAQKPAVWWPGWIWVAGTVVVLGRITLAQILLLALRVRREKITDGPLSERVRRIANAVGLRRKICLLRLPESISPMAFGLVRPCVGLPPNFEKEFSDAEQDAVLAHEFGHLAARDPMWFLLADIVSAFLWWHPFVWLARRSLHISSEMAADEATALVPDGPGSLAKCLVALGRRMTDGRGWGWVGINGGFRSKLGKRVERLLRMPSGSGRPLASWRDALARIAVTIIIVPTVVLAIGAFQTAQGESETSLRASWNDSPGALLLLAARDTADQPKKDIATQIEDGKLLYEKGKLDKAWKILTGVLKEDPTNRMAKYYLDLIKEAQYMDRHRHPGDLTPIPMATNNSGHPDPIPLGTNHQLVFVTTGRQNILSKLDHIYFDKVQYDLPLTEVLTRLTIASRKADAAGTGVNFLINPVEPSTFVDRPTPMDIGDVKIKISPALSNVRLVDVLNAIVMAADKPIKYTVEDYGVVFSPKSAEVQTLYSKVFHVTSRAFVQNLEKLSATKIRAWDAISSNGYEVDDGPRRAGEANDDFGGPTSSTLRIATPGKTNVTAKLDQVLRGYLASKGVNLEDPGTSVFFNERQGLLLVRATAQDLEIVRHTVEVLDQIPPQVNIEARFFNLPQKDIAALCFNWSLQSRSGTVTGVMSDSQFRAAVNAIEHRTGVDVLSVPKVTTLSGRQAHAGSMTGTNGATIDVIATVKTDGYTIGTFAWARVQMEAMNWSGVTTRDVQDGQTLVIGEVLTNQPEAGDLGLAFVTVTIIDPAGNRVHSDDELSRKH